MPRRRRRSPAWRSWPDASIAKRSRLRARAPGRPMNTFRFKLQKVLDWRRTQLDLEEARFKQQLAARRGAGPRTRRTGGRRHPRGGPGAPVEAGGGPRCDRTRRLPPARQGAGTGDLPSRRAKSQTALDAQEAAMLEARRRCRLLERLKERRRSGVAGGRRPGTGRTGGGILPGAVGARRAVRFLSHNGLHDARNVCRNRPASRPADGGRRQRAAPDDALPLDRLASAGPRTTRRNSRRGGGHARRHGTARRWPAERRLFPAGPQRRSDAAPFPAQFRGAEPGANSRSRVCASAIIWSRSTATSP